MKRKGHSMDTGGRNTKQKVEPDGTKEKDNPVKELFQVISAAYDDKNDRRDRLLQLSRDITKASKRLIFDLHRVCWKTPEEISKRVSSGSLSSIHDLIHSVAVELHGQPYWRYRRNFSGGLQEYVEAVSYLHFLTTGTLLSFEQANKNLTDHFAKKQENAPPKLTFTINIEDYLLGITDLTGEMMRMCINGTTKGHFDECKKIKEFLQRVYFGFFALPDTHEKEMKKKMSVMLSSVKKTEKACLDIVLKRAEFPDITGFAVDTN